MDEQSILTRTRAFVRETFLYARPGIELKDDERLLGKGIIDSMGVLELIAFLEQEFGVTMGDQDITERNLGSVASIAHYVAFRCRNGDRG